jgi:hypothetical protein
MHYMCLKTSNHNVFECCVVLDISYKRQTPSIKGAVLKPNKQNSIQANANFLRETSKPQSMRQIFRISYSAFGKQKTLAVCQTIKGHLHVPILFSLQGTLIAVLRLLQAEKHAAGVGIAIGRVSRKPKGHIQLEVPPFRVREKNPATAIFKSSPITLKLLELECPLI